MFVYLALKFRPDRTTSKELVMNKDSVFNDFVVNVADGVTKRIPRSQKSPLDYLQNENAHSFFIAPSAPHEVSDIIDALKIGKSLGPNSIPIKLLKILSPRISAPLSLIINESFLSGVFPEKNATCKSYTSVQKRMSYASF